MIRGGPGEDTRFLTSAGEHHDGIPVSLQDGLDLMHARKMLGSGVLEPSNSAGLSAIETFRFRSVEPRRRFQVLLKPRKVVS
jgi:hypothetical protein